LGSEFVTNSDTLVTPGLLQKNLRKGVTVREYFRLVVFFGVFFLRFSKIAKCNSPGVTTVFEILVTKVSIFERKIINSDFLNFLQKKISIHQNLISFDQNLDFFTKCDFFDQNFKLKLLLPVTARELLSPAWVY